MSTSIVVTLVLLVFFTIQTWSFLHFRNVLRTPTVIKNSRIIAYERKSMSTQRFQRFSLPVLKSTATLDDLFDDDVDTPIQQVGNEDVDEDEDTTSFDIAHISGDDESWEAMRAAAGSDEHEYHPWSANPSEYASKNTITKTSPSSYDDYITHFGVQDQEHTDPRDAIMLPTYATFYKFYPQYTTRNMPELMAAHAEYIKGFRRLSSCDEIDLNGVIGLCGLWKGTEEEAEETMAEIRAFMEGDPLIAAGVVELRDVIDLDKRSLWEAGRESFEEKKQLSQHHAELH